MATSSLNAKVGAVALTVGSLAVVGLGQIPMTLAPLNLLALGVLTLGAWAFGDEMGLRKPLNRGGFVVFIAAMFARIHPLLEPQSPVQGRYFLLYAFALLLAMLLWSVAFLHRQRDVKAAGAVGALVSVAPIVALIAGHLAVGAGAFAGIRALMAATDGAALTDLSSIHTIELIFALWSLTTARFLWRGDIVGA